MVILKDIIQKPITGEWGNEGDKVKVIRTTNFTNAGHINLDKIVSRNINQNKIEQKKLQKGDIIIEKSGGSPTQPVGRVVYFEEDGVFLCNNFTAVLRPKTDKVNPKYLHHILFANHKFGVTEKYQNKTTGIINLQLSRYIDNVKIPLPNAVLQKKITQILDDSILLKNKTEKLINEYDLLLESIFLDMFGDPILNLKSQKFEELNKLIIQKPDNGFFAKNEFYNDEGTPIVWLTDFIGKTFIENVDLKRVKISDKDLKYVLKYGDALFCRSSLTVDGIGKCSIVSKNIVENVIFECHIIRLQLDINKIVPEYFRFLSDTNYFRNNIMKSAKTSTMTTISQEGISSIKIPVPDYRLQIQFAEQVCLIEKQKELAKKELKESEDLFNCLLQKAFKGELV
jgi:type I restriction enzyme S subunit